MNERLIRAGLVTQHEGAFPYQGRGRGGGGHVRPNSHRLIIEPYLGGSSLGRQSRRLEQGTVQQEGHRTLIEDRQRPFTSSCMDEPQGEFSVEGLVMEWPSPRWVERLGTNARGPCYVFELCLWSIKGVKGFNGDVFCSVVKNCVCQTITDRFEGALPYPLKSLVLSLAAYEAV